ncbi:ATP-binding cassette domain-containing protein [Tumebacillus permanentifrigoris]|uniref:Sodium transport system ATP-binding protein n=1 Tax=Tumebacillus permanentifrigoris TaxID=378543 RepID=A0A316DB39_9BACL|nr:ATP-binding cassette domain-containing protein [Tumebacillus permanentifrigoris]PWK13826.1 sodium transport system ATP-binding protein [Tumebacillus permanentifrigoris]
MATVQFENVGLRDKHKQLYQDLSFTLEGGMMGAVYGPSRTGKSSLLLLASGHLQPERGVVRVDGKQATKKQAGLGPIHDLTPMFNTLTVEESLVFQGRLYGVRNAKARAKELLQQYDLLHVCKSRIKDVGHIEQFRVGLASALVHRPSLVLIDEPERGLTNHEWELAHRDLRALADEGHVVFLTTVLAQVADCCELIVSLPDGEVTTR